MAATLAVLLTGVVGGLLVLGFRTWRHSDARSQAQEQTLLVLSTLTAQIRHAQPDSIVVIASTGTPRIDSLTLLSNQGPDGETTINPQTGDIVWVDRVAIYGQNGQLFLQQSALPPNTTDVDPAQLAVNTVVPSAADHVTAHNITELAMALEQSGVVNIVVQATVDGLVCQQETTVASVQVSLAVPTASPSP